MICASEVDEEECSLISRRALRPGKYFLTRDRRDFVKRRCRSRIGFVPWFILSGSHWTSFRHGVYADYSRRNISRYINCKGQTPQDRNDARNCSSAGSWRLTSWIFVLHVSSATPLMPKSCVGGLLALLTCTSCARARTQNLLLKIFSLRLVPQFPYARHQYVSNGLQNPRTKMSY